MPSLGGIVTGDFCLEGLRKGMLLLTRMAVRAVRNKNEIITRGENGEDYLIGDTAMTACRYYDREEPCFRYVARSVKFRIDGLRPVFEPQALMDFELAVIREEPKEAAEETGAVFWISPKFIVTEEDNWGLSPIKGERRAVYPDRLFIKAEEK